MSALAYMTLVLATLRALSLRIVTQAICVLLISAVSQAPVSKSRISRAAASDGLVNAPWPRLSRVLAGAMRPKLEVEDSSTSPAQHLAESWVKSIGPFLCQRLVIEGLPQARHGQSSKMTGAVGEGRLKV